MPPVSHVTRIDEVQTDRGPTFTARCTCPWTSDTFTDRRGAAAAARMHRANMEVQQS